MATLHIIGNGFDLAHRIASKYSDFKKYAWRHANHRSYYLGALEGCYPDTNAKSGELMLWSNLEYALGNLDFQQAFSIGTEDVELEDGHELRYQAQMEDAPEYMLSSMFSAFHELFESWVNSIDIESEPLAHILHFAPKGLFLSFNYTETLETVYNIPRGSIRYLHGRRNTDDTLIVGHCNDIDGDNHLPEEPAIYEYQAYRNIAGIVNDERKNVTDIIRENNDFWQQLSDTNKVVVYGHSLSDVDRPYFNRTADSVNPASEWYFSIFYRSPQELINETKKILSMIDYMGVPLNRCHIFRM